MTRDEQLAASLRDATSRMGRLFRSAGNGGPNAVDLLDGIMHDVAKVAAQLDPGPRSPRALPSVEGRFSTGDVPGKGRVIRVETRFRRVRQAA